MLIYYSQEKKTKGTIFLSKILICLCIISQFTVEKKNCGYCLQALSTAEILKHVNARFEINGKQMIKMPKKVEYVRFKNN